MPDITTLSVPNALNGIGVVTIAKFSWDAALKILDERRKKSEEKRSGQREPLIQKGLAIGVASDAEAYAERRIAHLEKQVEQLEARNALQASELEAAAAEKRTLRGELTQLYSDLYKWDPRYRKTDGS
jgi:chromosome segregation ATPase